MAPPIKACPNKEKPALTEIDGDVQLHFAMLGA
jgi:hypothetical protein